MDAPLVDPAKHDAFSAQGSTLGTNYAHAKMSLNYVQKTL